MHPPIAPGAASRTHSTREDVVRVSRFIVLGLMLLAVVAGSCSRQGTESLSRLTSPDPGAAPGDTTPNPPPPPPPPPPPFPVVEFVGSDSVIAGHASVARFRVGNESNAPYTMPWFTNGGSNWPDFPMSGSIPLLALEQRVIELAFTVPDTAMPGPRWLELHVQRPDGSTTYATGGLMVINPSPPPPPPPPPPAAQPVTFVFADPMIAGATGIARFRVTNESAAPFSMQWSTLGGSGWPGFPMSGTIALAADETRDLDLTIAVPDTAVAGPRWLEMHVTRPNGLGEGYAYGTMWVVP
jgi:hypothetical protein